MKLYQLTDQYQTLLDDITDCTDDGVEFENLASRIESLEGDITEKLEACAKMVRALDARAKAFKNEELFFKAKAKSANNSAESLEEYVQSQMEKIGMEEVKGKTLNVRLCRNGNPRLICDGKVPRGYLVKPPPELNSEKIKQDLLAGKTLRFARLKYGKHIRIS